MDLAKIGELAENFNGVKYPVVRLDLFDSTEDTKRMRTKGS